MTENLKYSNRVDLAKPVLWLAFAAYVFLSGYTIAHHEMWGDEIHSWNIVKASAGFFDLMHNIRYEGHPPLWYLVMWNVSKFTHNPAYVQGIHWFIALVSVFLILFYSPLPISSRLLLPFGYYFLFEYTVLSRNYALAVLLTICICIILRKDFRYKMLLYYGLLYLLVNTHLLGMLIAASLHLYFLFVFRQKNPAKPVINIHTLIGPLIIIAAVYFIFPPSDSEMNVQFWLSRWGVRNFINFGQAPLRAFIPVAAWWKYDFWNSEFIIEFAKGNNILVIISVCLSVFIVTCLILALQKNRASQVLFCGNLLFSFITAMTFFTLGSARYAGFLYIAFIAAYWLYCYKTSPAKKYKFIINGLLIIQLIASVTPVVRDIKYPFSNAYRVNELLEKVPPNEKTVTDYWALNAIEAFADRSFYCVDLQKEVKFLKWDAELKSKLSNPYRYSDGVNKILEEEGVNRLYLVSIVSPPILSGIDKKLSGIFNVKLVGKVEGAIEPASNLYLYEISKPVISSSH